LLGYWLRRSLRWRLPSEDLVIDGGDGVRLLARASWQHGEPERSPGLVIVHGLGGSDASGYVCATGALAWRRGWHVLRMNMRGCGDALSVCPLLYNAGLETDLLAVLETAAARLPQVAVVGFSLGANLALLALGRSASRVPDSVRAAVAVSPPLDLAACTTQLERPTNRLYQRYLTASLCQGYRDRRQLRPDLYPPGRERGINSVRAFDEAITAPHGGFESAADYYACSSSGPHIASIERPTLVLAAQDDPMIPIESVTGWPLPGSGCVRREALFTGGHVGFSGDTEAPAGFWAAERALDFIAETTGNHP